MSDKDCASNIESLDSSCCSEKNRSLQLDENHFSDDVLAMDTVSEIEGAIVKCKENILSLQETSEEKRLLVQRLVKLRLKLQEVQEIQIYMDFKKMKIVQSHKFCIQSVTQLKFQTSQMYCETCSGLIWIPLQSCFLCSDCEYVSHGQCLNGVRRICASVKVKENPTYMFEICPEKSLKTQNYRCAECKAGISFSISETNSLNQPILCDYSGNYYCHECHWGSLSVIPARVASNWDFQPRAVSRGIKQYLKLMMKKSIINLEELNPRLFSFVEELAFIKRLRMDIIIMKEYMLTCKGALGARLLRILEDRQHFVENSDHYSLQDLIDVHNKTLISYLEPIHNQFLCHITQDCEGCKGKGHVCHLCEQLPVIFAFESHATTCKDCHSVYHRNCLNKKDAICLKCSVHR